MAGTNIDRDQILAIEPVDHVAGPDTAAVTVLTYCDFECPYCRRASLVIKRLRGPLQDRLRYVFRNFPLTAKHPFAQQAAEIAEAAGAQGKFWPMHDFLFDNQETLEIEDLYEYAAMIGLDATRLQNEVADRVYAARVARDRDSGMQLGVTGTPTFFVNRQRHTDEDTLEQALRRAA
jgi:protein-disulfide isomerase